MKLDKSKYLKSRSVRPLHVLFALLLINLLLAIIVWAFPQGGISLGRTGQIKFISFNDLFGVDSTLHKVDLETVLADVEIFDEQDTSTINGGPRDSLFYAKLAQQVTSSVHFDPLTGKLATPTHRSIQLPPKNPDALQSLVKGLLEESQHNLIRIIHYGDSQLEGDRITDYVRNRLQGLFGGEGPGILLPNEPTADSRISAHVSQSENVQKKAIYTAKHPASNNRYGIGGASFVFGGNTSQFVGWDTLSRMVDSVIQLSVIPRFDGSIQTPSYIRVGNARRGYRRNRSYSNIRLLYRSEKPFLLRFTRDSSSDTRFVRADTGLAILQWKTPAYEQVRFDIVKGGFPEIYGVALDGKHGVAVDNFPMRGSSAIGFTKMDPTLYSAQLKEMNVRCIILQYGINVVPIVRTDYSYYRRSLARQIASMQKALPGVSIIVVGPSDMSTNKAGNMVSYEHIPLIRDAMKNAAFDRGCAFWDLYEAMGGQNSMVSWVDNGLAQKDYTHFSYKGAKYVGEMLFEALMEQLQQAGYSARFEAKKGTP